MSSAFERLKERKLFQWAAAYVAGAWLVLQLVDVLGERWGISAEVARALDGLLILGLLLTLVLAWYHGERGRQRVSGAELLIITLLLGVGGGVVRLFGSSGADAARSPVVPPPDDRIAIAVLPFENMSDDPANQYFSDGISEEILNLLAGVPGIRVPSRTSAFSFRDRDVPVREIAAQLRVDRVLDGSVRKMDNRVRITAQLIDAETDSPVWSETYERELEDIFAIQQEISSSIVRALPSALDLRDAGASASVERPTANIDAYQTFLRGLYSFNNLRDLELAIELFERAVELDPRFARAWASLAYAYIQAALYTPASMPELLARAEGAVDRALGEDPSLPTAHGALGWLRVVQTRWSEGERSLIRAIEMGGGDALPYLRYGTLLIDVGRTRDAREVLLRAAELDPLNGITAHWLADAYRNLGQMEESRFHSQRSVDLGLAGSGVGIYLYHLRRDEYDLAIEALERFESMAGIDPSYVRPLVRAVRDSTTTPAAVEALRRVAETHPRFEPSQFMFDLAVPTVVFDELDRMVEEGTIVFGLWRLWEPELTRLRRHPRFAGLASRIGLIDYWREAEWPDLCEPEGSGFRCG